MNDGKKSIVENEENGWVRFRIQFIGITIFGMLENSTFL